MVYLTREQGEHGFDPPNQATRSLWPFTTDVKFRSKSFTSCYEGLNESVRSARQLGVFGHHGGTPEFLVDFCVGHFLD